MRTFLNVCQSLSRAILPGQWGWFNWDAKLVAAEGTHVKLNSRFVGAEEMTGTRGDGGLL